MASREEDGFLSLHETETAGQAMDSRDCGAAKRAAAGSTDERSSGSNPKRAKTAARTAKEPGPTAAAILDNRHRNALSDGDGLQGPNPHTERPDAMSYSGTEEIRHEQPCRGDADTAGGRNALERVAVGQVLPSESLFYRAVLQVIIEEFYGVNRR
ncbi:UNVERIFIED_CONTAM: hypothetical protein K2H54_072311 [Gekko kuhli]